MAIWSVAYIVKEASESDSQNSTSLILVRLVILLIIGNQKLYEPLCEKCSTDAVFKSGMSRTWKNVFETAKLLDFA